MKCLGALDSCVGRLFLIESGLLGFAGPLAGVILGFLIIFRWLPPMVYTPFWVSPWQNLQQLIWPALAVGYRYSAVAARMTRSAMLEGLRGG